MFLVVGGIRGLTRLLVVVIDNNKCVLRQTKWRVQWRVSKRASKCQHESISLRNELWTMFLVMGGYEGTYQAACHCSRRRRPRFAPKEVRGMMGIIETKISSPGRHHFVQN